MINYVQRELTTDNCSRLNSRLPAINRIAASYSKRILRPEIQVGYHNGPMALTRI